MFPEIDGFAECWGKTIIHCPYCHGYEFRGQKTAIWVNAANAWHLAPLIRNLTKNVTLLTNGDTQFTAEEKQKLTANGIAIIQSKISRFHHLDGNLQGVTFDDGVTEKFDALYAGLPFEQHCTVPAELGCEFTDTGYIKTDMFKQWQSIAMLVVCLMLTLTFKKLNTVILILIGSIGGYLLLHI